METSGVLMITVWLHQEELRMARRSLRVRMMMMLASAASRFLTKTHTSLRNPSTRMIFMQMMEEHPR